MATVFDSRRRGTNRIPRDLRRTALAAALAMMSGVMLLTLPGTHLEVWASWVASSVALAGALTLLVVGERAWAPVLVSARAAGVVAPY